MATGRWVLILALTAGCTTMRDRGDTFYKQGKYEDAEHAYDQYLSSHPNDKKALAGRTAARVQILRGQIVRVQELRTGGQSLLAANELASLLAHRDGWHERLAADLANAIELEISDAGARIGGEIVARVGAAGPLAGEDVAHQYGRLLAQPALASTRGALSQQLADFGKARCASLTAEEPYTQWLVASYCAHWGISRPVPPLPEQRSQLVVDGSVTSETARQTIDLHSALAAAFERTAWFSATSTATAHATVTGVLEVEESSTPVTLTASWTDSVPYTDYETQQESYQEPYDDTETYYEQVPSTEYRTETTACGDSTCTNTVPETVYHSELRTRTVTKYRTAYRDITVPVTRYRDVPRTRDYSAIQRSASYRTDLRVQIDRGMPAIGAVIDLTNSESGYDHDVTISEAGVWPSRANLTTHAELADHEQTRLADQFAASLDRAYRERFCSATTYSLSDAARCAYASTADLPEAARAALASLLGEESRYVAALER